MDSITLGWKKPATGGVKILNRQPRSQKQAKRKVPEKKKQVNQVQIPQIQTIRVEEVPVEKQSHTPFPTLNTARKSTVKPDTVIQVSNTSGLCSTRAAIATFIIIIIIIILAGAAIGIMFAAIRSQNSSSNGNNTSNNNQNSFSTASTSLLTSTISIGNQIGLPCAGYTEINDPSRSHNYTGSSGACDDSGIFNASNGGSWIRFVGSGGTTIPLISPGTNHCGAFLSSWFNDTLTPTPNVVKNGTVCFETYAHLCGVSIDISVVYCAGGYYVYLLPPVSVCSSRYCTA